jgi:hypothetical protein
MRTRKIIAVVISILFIFNSITQAAPIEILNDTLRAQAAGLSVSSAIQHDLTRPVREIINITEAQATLRVNTELWNDIKKSDKPTFAMDVRVLDPLYRIVNKYEHGTTLLLKLEDDLRSIADMDADFAKAVDPTVFTFPGKLKDEFLLVRLKGQDAPVTLMVYKKTGNTFGPEPIGVITPTEQQVQAIETTFFLSGLAEEGRKWQGLVREFVDRSHIKTASAGYDSKSPDGNITVYYTKTAFESVWHLNISLADKGTVLVDPVDPKGPVRFSNDSKFAFVLTQNGEGIIYDFSNPIKPRKVKLEDSFPIGATHWVDKIIWSPGYVTISTRGAWVPTTKAFSLVTGELIGTTTVKPKSSSAGNQQVFTNSLGYKAWAQHIGLADTLVLLGPQNEFICQVQVNRHSINKSEYLDNGFEFSPDGKFIAIRITGEHEKTAYRIYNLLSRKQITTVQTKADWLMDHSHFIWMADSRYFLIEHEMLRAKANLVTGYYINDTTKPLFEESNAEYMSASPDGRYVVITLAGMAYDDVLIFDFKKSQNEPIMRTYDLENDLSDMGYRNVIFSLDSRFVMLPLTKPDSTEFQETVFAFFKLSNPEKMVFSVPQADFPFRAIKTFEIEIEGNIAELHGPRKNEIARYNIHTGEKLAPAKASSSGTSMINNALIRLAKTMDDMSRTWHAIGQTDIEQRDKALSKAVFDELQRCFTKYPKTALSKPLKPGDVVAIYENGTFISFNIIVSSSSEPGYAENIGIFLESDTVPAYTPIYGGPIGNEAYLVRVSRPAAILRLDREFKKLTKVARGFDQQYGGADMLAKETAAKEASLKLIFGQSPTLDSGMITQVQEGANRIFPSLGRDKINWLFERAIRNEQVKRAYAFLHSMGVVVNTQFEHDGSQGILNLAGIEVNMEKIYDFFRTYPGDPRTLIVLLGNNQKISYGDIPAEHKKSSSAGQQAGLPSDQSGIKATEALRARIAELTKQALSEYANVRVHALEALRGFGDLAAPAAPELAKALSNEDPDVYYRAAGALYHLGNLAAPAAPELAKALSDKNPDVRVLAAEALHNLGNLAAPAAPELAKALSDKNPDVLYIVVRALYNLRNLAVPAVPELIKALSDENPDVRDRAAKALRDLAALAAIPLSDAYNNAIESGNTTLAKRIEDILNYIAPAKTSSAGNIANSIRSAQEMLISKSPKDLVYDDIAKTRKKLALLSSGIARHDMLADNKALFERHIALQNLVLDLAELTGPVAQIQKDSQVIFDPAIIPDNEQRQIVIGMFKDKTFASVFGDEESLPGVVLLEDVLSGKVAVKKNSILISNAKKLENVRLLHIEGIRNVDGYFPAPHLIGYAKGLISIDKDNFNRLYSLLNRLHIKLTGMPMADELRDALENNTWSVVSLIIDILPSVEALGTQGKEKLHRQAIMALIAA